MAHQTNSTNSHGHGEHQVGHIVSPKILIATAVALLILTAITVWSAQVDFSRVGLPEMDVIVAMAIAVIKASLVGLFFMHLRWDRPFNGFVLVTSLAFVALFITFALTDTREYRRSIIDEESTLIQQRLAELPPPGTPLPAEEAEGH